MLNSMAAWLGLYAASLAVFIALGVRDPDVERRSVIWPMAASFGGLAALAAARTVFVGIPLGVGPWAATWLVVAALTASAGRPVLLAVGTPLDPKLAEITDREERRGKRARTFTLLIFGSGLAIGLLLRPDLLEL